MTESHQDQLREFHIELEMLVATMLRGVPISAIKQYYGDDDMAAIVAKVLTPLRRHARGR